MIGAVDPRDVERFRELILRRLGLRFEDAKLGFLGDVLQRRVDAARRPCALYLNALDGDPAADELGALATELTVPETYFFRNNEQFRALAEIVLPERLQARPRALRFLSAGCATGEEPYTIAIMLRELVPNPACTLHIRAVDINPAALAKARRAHYSPWALRETPDDIKRKWFHTGKRDAALDESIRNAVRFDERNLTVDDRELWSPGTYDAIFCRNVIMYFSPEHAQAVIARIAHALAPGGYLFLGHAETLRGLSEDFHLCHTHGTFYYQRKEALGAALAASPAMGPAVAPGLPTAPPSLPSFNDAWVEVIRVASERVEFLTQPRAAPLAAPVPPAPRRLDTALDLLRQERFSDALAELRDLPADARDPDALLLEAMLLAHGGHLATAEEACRALLAGNELNAGAHYVFALCREGAGDRDGAAEQDRMAVYLDPAFAMPRLHLGLLARKAGDREAARRDLAQALVLLRQEDASRLLLFGGGFNRAALVALCSSALRDCGGQA
jgi:chemotaxis protein methyltransferase CheR